MYNYLNLNEMIEKQLDERKDQVAYRFITDDETEQVLTVGQLNTEVNKLANCISEYVKPGDRVMLGAQPGLEFIISFFACLRVGCIAVPIFPPATENMAIRFVHVISDCDPSLILFDKSTAFDFKKGVNVDRCFPKIIKKYLGMNDGLLSLFYKIRRKKIRYLSTSERKKHSSLYQLNVTAELDDLAVLQYTSGSTGNPKGVMLTHKNFLHNLETIRKAACLTEKTHMFSWLPPYHDMGLVSGVLSSIYNRITSTNMSPTHFIKNPSRWMEYISKYGCTATAGPDFALDLCARKTTAEQIRQLDLSQLEVIKNGSEHISAKIMANFQETFKPAGLRSGVVSPGYGLAESVLLISSKPPLQDERIISVDAKKLQENIVDYMTTGWQTIDIASSGKPCCSIKIVDLQTETECSDNNVGEIWTSSSSVAAGYYNRKKETQSTFKQKLNSHDSNEYLKTGDLGFMNEGELFICGRLKHVIIINGNNYYPHDIEDIVEFSDPLIRPGCVIAYSDIHDEKETFSIIAEVKEIKDSISYENTVDNIIKALSYQITLVPFNIYLIPPKKIPKTTSGKLKRNNCYEYLVSRNIPILHHYKKNSPCIKSLNLSEDRNWIVELRNTPTKNRTKALSNLIIEEIRGILEYDSSYALHDTDEFMQLGFDSIKAIELQFNIQRKLRNATKIDPTMIFLYKTIQDAASHILSRIDFNKSVNTKKIPICEKAKLDRYPASYTQKALFFIDYYHDHSCVYNVPILLELEETLNIDKLNQAVNKLIIKHPILRTSYHYEIDELYQHIHDSVRIEINTKEFSGSDPTKFVSKDINTAFDLNQPTQFSVTLYKGDDNKCFLLFVFHHITIDNWSLNKILLPDLYNFYGASPIGHENERKLEYIDYSVWQNESDPQVLFKKQNEYWTKKLSGSVPAKLITKNRKCKRQLIGNSITKEINVASYHQMNASLIKHKVTLHSYLTSVLSFLVWKYTNSNDVIIGTPVANRQYPGTDDIVGFFTNTVAIRNIISDTTMVDEFIEQCNATICDAINHQELPFGEVIKSLGLNHDSSLFQVMLVVQNAPIMDEFSDKELKVKRFIDIDVHARSNITVIATNFNDRINLKFNYDTALFDESFVEQFADHFITALDLFCSSSQAQLKSLNILNESEQKNLIEISTGASTKNESSPSLLSLFQQNVARNENNLCVKSNDQTLTYKQLDLRSNQLARYIKSRGISPGDIVAVCLERSIDLIVTLLGLIKVGCIFTPIDTAHPKHRVNIILNDASPKLIITQSKFFQLFSQQGKTISLDTVYDQINQEDCSSIEVNNTKLEDNAYLLFTSGTTGKPKGALNTHLGIINRILWAQDLCQLTSTDRVLQKTALSFDPSIWEIFWPICSGATLVIAEPDIHRDPIELIKSIKHNAITVTSFVPSVLELVVDALQDDSLSSLRYVFCGGERLLRELNNKFFKKIDATLYQTYGPTECAISMTYFKCSPDATETYIPIGAPIQNTQAFVLDNNLNLLPIGCIGELYIGGACVGNGYLNNDALTSEKFIENPFDYNSRLYKTGDLFKISSAGQFEFIGRRDNQIKLRGHRIELEEIEMNIKQIPEVDFVVVKINDTEKQLEAFVVSDISAIKIKQNLAKKFPNYMIPSKIHLVDELPMLESGKVDRNRISEVEESNDSFNNDITYSSPLEEKVAKLWQSILKVKTVNHNDNFFMLGGHSLTAVRLVFTLNNEFDIKLSVKDLFKHPVFSNFMSFINNNEVSEDESDKISVQILKTMYDALNLPNIDHPIEIPHQNHLFLTGGTGFLGAYLMRDLQKEFPESEITVLVRATDKVNAINRLKKICTQYNLTVDFSRINPVLGDLAKPNLGLSKDDYNKLSKRVDIILHNGALVNFISSYSDLEPTNVQGTKEVLKLAVLNKIKPVHYVSSLSIIPKGIEFENNLFQETSSIEKDGYLQGGYAQSKWVAEKYLLDASQRGVPIKIYRPSRITGDSKTGLGNENDLFFRFIRGCLQTNSIPNVEFDLNLIPVDYVSQFIVLAIKSNCSQHVFNVVCAQKTEFQNIIKSFMMHTKEMETVPYNIWRDQLLLPDNLGKENAFYPLINLLPKSEEEFLSVVKQPNICQQHMQAIIETNKEHNFTHVNQSTLDSYIQFVLSTHEKNSQ